MALSIKNTNLDTSTSYIHSNSPIFLTIINTLKKDNNRTFSKYDDLVLDTGSDSVMEYSIISHKTGRPELPIAQSNCKIGFLPLIKGIDRIYLETANVSNVLVKDVSLITVVNSVKTIQLLDKYEQVAEDDTAVLAKYMENKILNVVNLDIIRKSIQHMKSTMSKEDCDKGRYHCSNGIDCRLICREWKRLNYFPELLFETITYTNDSKRNINNKNELYIIIFVTMGLELSKVFVRVMKICNSDSGSVIPCDTVLEYLDIIMECSIESHSSEMLIDIEEVLLAWFAKANLFDQYRFVSWTRQRQVQYYSTDLGDDDSEDEHDLMFNKYDICRILLTSLSQHCTVTDQVANKRKRCVFKEWITNVMRATYTIESVRYYRGPLLARRRHCLLSGFNTTTAIDSNTDLQLQFNSLFNKEQKGMRKRDVVMLLFT